MNRLAKKSAALLLALVMALSMAACGVKPGGEQGQGASGEPDGNIVAEQEEGGADAPAEESPGEQNEGTGTEEDDELFGELEEGTGIPGIDAATWMDSDIQEWVRLSDEAAPAEAEA